VMCAEDPSLLPLVFAALKADRVEDTRIREQLLAVGRGDMQDEAGGRSLNFDLASVVARRFHTDISADKTGEDVWRLRYSELDGVPVDQWPDEAARYAKDDIRWLLRVYASQAQDNNPNVRAGRVVDSCPQARAAWCLHLAAMWGLRTDPAATLTLKASLESEMKEIDTLLEKEGLVSSVVKKGVLETKRNMKVLQERILAVLGEDTPRTDSGKVSTERAVLEDVANRTDDEGLRAMARRSAVEKILGTYVPVLVEGTQVPINAGWNVLLATGRTSCREPNWQNLPRKAGVRECVVPRPGYLFGSCDYSFIELVTLAQVCLYKYGESALAKAINAGLDPHLDMAASLLGITYAEASARKKEPQIKEARQMAKALNFGLPGGLGVDSFVSYAAATYGVVMSSEEASKRRKEWYAKWPEMKRYHDELKAKFRHASEIPVLQVGSGRTRGNCRFTQAANTYFQGLAADGAKRAMFRIAEECYVDAASPLYGSRMVVFAHDEFILEVPEQGAAAAMTRLADLMISGMAELVPAVKVSAEGCLMRRWYKGAEPTYVDGVLVPWEPKEKAA
jgi:DNA polymerase-1